MTNWPNIQEYRNFEAKFNDDPKRNVLIDSAANSNLETVIQDEYTAKSNSHDIQNNQKLQNPESKIVRCVIRKDFEEAFKKVEREDGDSLSHECTRPKPQETVVVDRSFEKIRLQNHLKWKKQKEEEYLQKKEAEKIAQQKKKEEELRLEKARKQKEKERTEKLRAWQEQKAREKEEKKKEKMVIKMLEEEFKVPPSVDKEKLIEEWVKLKNKQKQIEAEKKAELLKKEEETRALRQTLAELSYRKWKERVKGRIMTLPKNGYQIFGPKPVPVVKEDWNHDFTRSSPRSPNYRLRHTKSGSTTTLTLSPAVKELDDLSKDIFYLGDLQTRSPSFFPVKKMKSGMNLNGCSEAYQKGQCEMPLKELQPGTVDLKQKGAKKLKDGFEKSRRDFTSHDLNTESEISFFSKFSGSGNRLKNHLNDFVCFTGAQGDQNRFIVSPEKKQLELLNAFPDAQILPNKKKIDLYINTSPDDVEENSEFQVQRKQTSKSSSVKISKDRKTEKTVKTVPDQAVKNASKEKLFTQNRTRSLSLQKFDKNRSESLRSIAKKPVERDTVKSKPCRRTQSCDKPLKKASKGEQAVNNDCSLSKSVVKVTETVDARKNLTKCKTSCSQKRKSRKVTAVISSKSEVIPSKSEKRLLELDYKNKKKLKKKNSLSKSFSFNDSPYCVKNSSKGLNKVKPARRRNTKDIETKSDEGGQCRRSSATKI